MPSKSKAGTRKNANANANSYTQLLSGPEIRNMENMKKEFFIRKEVLDKLVENDIGYISYLNLVIAAVKLKEKEVEEKGGVYLKYIDSVMTKNYSLNSVDFPVRIYNGKLLIIADAKRAVHNPHNIVVREKYFVENLGDFNMSRKVKCNYKTEIKSLYEWKGSDPLLEVPQVASTFTIDESLLYGKAREWSINPLNWIDYPGKKLNPKLLQRITLFKKNASIMLSYNREKENNKNIIGVFNDYDSRLVEKVPDLKFCSKNFWIEAGLLYDESNDKGWELPKHYELKDFDKQAEWLDKYENL